MDATRGTVEARLRVDAPPAYLRDDMTVSVEIVSAEKANAIVVPNAALRDTASGAVVLAIQDGRAVATAVKLGIRTPQSAEVLSGIAEGAVVVIDSTVLAGSRVRGVTQEPKAPRSGFEPPLPGR